MNVTTAGLALLLLLAATACSSQQVYDSTSELPVQECSKLEPRDRAACQQRARMPYPEYRKNRSEAAGGPEA